jgi:imidazolonepropionase-like amidohydrolase
MKAGNRRIRLAAFLAAALIAAPLCAAVAHAADSAARWVAVSNGEAVGHLHAERDGASVAIDYFIDNNGRGPKVREQLTLDERGYPLDWTIEGSSLFGAPVDEAYRWQDGEVRWRSQADRGEQAAAVPPMYIGGDASPWSLEMYARALLAAEGQSIDVLPSGRLRLERIAERTAGEDATPITFYELSGIDLQPALFALDRDHHLFVNLGGRGALIREGYESSLPELQEWARAHELACMHALQQRLAHRFEQPVRYINVRVFDPAVGRSSEPQSVLVRDGRVAAIEPVPPAGAAPGEVVVDGAGGTLLAGLYDMHAHNSLDSGLYYLAAGVTSTRDMGNDNTLLAEIRAAVEAGELPGPRITPAGLIEARSPFSARIGIVAETLDEALGAVRWYAQHGFHEIKTYNSMNPEWVPALVAEARRQGLGVSGHVPAFMAPDEVIRAGYDSIAHINQLMLGWLLEEGEDTRTALRLTAMKRGATLDLHDPRVQHTVALMREHGTALDTTAVILERLMLSRAGEVQPGDAPYLEHMPIGYQRYRKRTFVPLDEPGDDAAFRAGVEKMLAVIKLLHDSEVGLLVGTDDTTGFTVHRELELYVKAGIPAPAVLAIATLGSARYLGEEDQLGSIEAGKLADFLLVDGDPATDISAIRQVRAVSRGGVVYFPDQIYPALGIQPFAARPEVLLPAEHAP